MSDVALFLISLAITVFGLAASWAAYRRGGAATALRGVAWSLVPMAAYLTGLTEWLTGVVFNPVKWAGAALGGLAVLLYIVSGVMLSRRPPRAERKAAAATRAARGRSGAGGGTAATGGSAVGRSKVRGEVTDRHESAPFDDELAEVEEILRRRGID